MENELYHHGIKGMKWGVRRYQNLDGSLTNAGRKKYGTKTNFERVQAAKKAATIGVKKRKAMEKANARTAKEIAKYEKKAGLNKSESKSVVKSKPILKSNSKPKTINEMTNEEIQERIDRINLENKLISLTPQKVSAGQRFVNGVKGAAISIAKEKGTKIVGDYIDKQVREKLGIKDEKSMSKILQEKAQDYENRQKIDKGQKYFKEGKYAEKNTAENKDSNNTNSNDAKNNDNQKTERWSWTVEGEGTSRYTKKESPIFDADYKETNSESINNGRKYINRLLLEDKKGR